HQHAQRDTKLRGQAGLLALIAQMEGFEVPAGHWEKYLLPSRLESFSPSWLDGLTFFGQVTWGRLRPPAKIADLSPMPSEGSLALPRARNGRPIKALTRSTPITLMRRDDITWLLPSAEENAHEALAATLGSNARAAYDAFLRHGALFPAQLSA